MGGRGGRVRAAVHAGRAARRPDGPGAGRAGPDHGPRGGALAPAPPRPGHPTGAQPGAALYAAQRHRAPRRAAGGRVRGRRATLVTLTDSGAAVATAWHAGYRQAAARLFDGVPPGDLSTFVTVLDRVLARLDNATSTAGSNAPG